MVDEEGSRKLSAGVYLSYLSLVSWLFTRFSWQNEDGGEPFQRMTPPAVSVKCVVPHTRTQTPTSAIDTVSQVRN